MTRARQDRLLAMLARDGQWVTAAQLADALGVTDRSVRSYVAAVNARVTSQQAVESGPLGYRAGPDAALAQRAMEDAAGPRSRLHALIRALAAQHDGIDVHETADRLHVSSATVESDLSRVRAVLAGTGLTLERTSSRARLIGAESAQRRLLSRLAHAELDADAFDLDAVARVLGGSPAEALGAFKTGLVDALHGAGYQVNELGLGDVLLHIALAADRARAGRPLETTPTIAVPAAVAEVAAIIGELSARHLDVGLGEGDRRHLAALVLTRVAASGARDVATVSADVARAVRDVVEAAASHYLVDLVDDEFIARLSLHVQNLVHRARDRAWSRNPMTRSLKAAHPMIFEVAVVIAAELSQRLSIPLLDDEIAYIAMHVGARLERDRRSDRLLTATIVSPAYYDVHEMLRASVGASLGQVIDVVAVETRVDCDWEGLDTDLVLTTVEPAAAGERFVRIQPFLTDADIERVQHAAARVRRSRRLAQLGRRLGRYFSADAFVRGLGDDGHGEDGEEAVIRRLGALLVARGVIDDDYLQRAIARERLSSTAFTDALAVPHAIGMTAARTEIAIGIAEPSIPWGDGRVQVVALVAFSENDREAFQTVFEQFVEVFADREAVQRIVRRGTDFAGFFDELLSVIDG